MKKIINLLVLGLIVTGFSSCLKDDSIIGPDAPGATKNIIEFLNPDHIASGTTSTYPLYIKNFDIKPTGSTVIEVAYSGVDVAPEDIAVKVDLAPDAITKYNSDNTKSYTPLPTTLYSLTSLNLVIPKGQRTASFTINVKPDQFDLNAAYALGFKISSASTGIISGNFGTIVVALGAKNKYDGIYTLDQTAPMFDATSSTLVGYYPIEQELRTTGASSVTEYDGRYAANNYAHPIKSGTSTSSYGNFSPIFNMDDAGNVVSVTNYFGQGTNSSGRSARLNPSGVNKFTVNGDTKVLQVSYIMVQNGVDRTFFYEKWTYKAAR
ncbi:hypothetical protein OC25_08395 [Pedobacter kyungheensis]|uniref:BT-3987-like N-terminal domain-containing protein n=1 Tax=Pedobacter kyungheensis TaxID=1069985 RepID=A0A0C1DBP6_9SPHI|nr:DUF1735 domain-containing protein [Pedobacter kyungheensis]KIA94941.1 hypothetical protein OC25_08395 [Pedobacter kyungheensis]